MTSSSPQFTYRNITVSGLPGSGSTTLLNMLKQNESLVFGGWRGFSGGEFMRAYAIEKGLFDAKNKFHHEAECYDDDFDRQVDLGMREKLQSEKGWILEAWLSGFMAQQVAGVLKVLVICSDDAVRVDRIVNRDGISVAEAKEHINKRYQSNLDKWRRLYADQWQEWVVDAGTLSSDEPIDFWRPELYDVVIDTFSVNQQETLKTVLDAIEPR